MRQIRLLLFFLLTPFLFTSCITAYQASGLTGGYEEMRLNANTYRVRFDGNGYTSESLTSKYIMRRCAELTLENGKRYFELVTNDTKSTVSGFDGIVNSFPSSVATIRILDQYLENEERIVLDAVFIMEETAAAAKGVISPKASAMIQKFKAIEDQTSSNY